MSFDAPGTNFEYSTVCTSSVAFSSARHERQSEMPSLVLVRMSVQVPGPVPPSAAGQRASANCPTAPVQALPIAVFSLPLALVMLVADFASGHGPTILPAATPASHFCSS